MCSAHTQKTPLNSWKIFTPVASLDNRYLHMTTTYTILLCTILYLWFNLNWIKNKTSYSTWLQSSPLPENRVGTSFPKCRINNCWCLPDKAFFNDINNKSIPRDVLDQPQVIKCRLSLEETDDIHGGGKKREKNWWLEYSWLLHWSRIQSYSSKAPSAPWLSGGREHRCEGIIVWMGGGIMGGGIIGRRGKDVGGLGPTRRLSPTGAIPREPVGRHMEGVFHNGPVPFAWIPKQTTGCF